MKFVKNSYEINGSAKVNLSLLIIALIFIGSLAVNAQTFIVEKVSGDVQVLEGTSENWTAVKNGQTLNGTDIIATGKGSYVKLNNNGSYFILQGNSALNVNSIKKMSLNDLLLALAMEEIRNVPKSKSDPSVRNTAVYGKNEGEKVNPRFTKSDLGFKKLNGAKQLVESGYIESAIVVAKETYRKYPDTKNDIKDRIYFADQMMKLELYNEAASELNELKKINTDDASAKEIDEKLSKINEKIAGS